jgi:hypothetical protein
MENPTEVSNSTTAKILRASRRHETSNIKERGFFMIGDNGTIYIKSTNNKYFVRISVD